MQAIVGEDLVRQFVFVLGGEGLVRGLRGERDEPGARLLELREGLCESTEGDVAVRTPAVAVLGEEDGGVLFENGMKRDEVALGVRRGGEG